MMYMINCMVDAILKTISIKQKMVNFKKHSPIVLLTSETLYCHHCSGDFTYFVCQARELFLHSWLTFHENGPIVLSSELQWHDKKPLNWGRGKCSNRNLLTCYCMPQNYQEKMMYLPTSYRVTNGFSKSGGITSHTPYFSMSQLIN